MTHAAQANAADCRVASSVHTSGHRPLRLLAAGRHPLSLKKLVVTARVPLSHTRTDALSRAIGLALLLRLLRPLRKDDGPRVVYGAQLCGATQERWQVLRVCVRWEGRRGKQTGNVEGGPKADFDWAT